ncbi:hypothetical protein EST38_g7294 [Candolleomyces aberdarensis]|uniref:Uncharacterized protein n=1 Tax=Candolleomyces aberdarensis TaxID=2316362 RepID=A0A4Q2DHH8_9AGAR|nr:hypothetical protein EST38_g7294 [Candolleomyces aberdarensis]
MANSRNVQSSSETEAPHLYLVNIGSPNATRSALQATSWSLLLIDELHPEKATLHSLGATRPQSSQIHRLKNSFLYNGAGPSLTNDVQMLLSPPMEIDLTKYAGGTATRGTENIASGLLEHLIKRALPLSSLLPPPPADSFDSFDSDFDSKRGILSAGCVILSYCHVGTFSRDGRLTSESFRQCLSNALFAVLDKPSSYSCGATAKSRSVNVDRDLELWATQEWAVRAISSVRNSFNFNLSSGIPSLVDGSAPVKKYIGKALDARRADMV